MHIHTFGKQNLTNKHASGKGQMKTGMHSMWYNGYVMYVCI